MDFRGQKRTNETHAGYTDPEARLYRKGVGREAKLSHMGRVPGENRHGPIVGVAAPEASGAAEREAARDPKTVPRKDQVPDIRARRRMQDRMRTDGYALSQRCRKKIEEGIGWIKTVAGLARGRWVGRWKLRQVVEVAAAAYNRARMRRLIPAG